MSNVDMSLGELISSRKTSTRGRAARGRRGGARAPAGGVGKNTVTKVPTTTARGAARAAAAAAVATQSKGNRKILVSGLPTDINESHIKEYFTAKVGKTIKIELSYDKNGKFRGIATVVFRQPLAEKATAEHNGVPVDGKPIRVEVVYDANNVAAAPAAKSLSERAQPRREAVAPKEKAKPKKVETAKKERKGLTAGEAGRGKRGRTAGRPKKKTAEELDAEMTDYFGVGGAGATASGSGVAAPAAAAPAADNAMEDEVL